MPGNGAEVHAFYDALESVLSGEDRARILDDLSSRGSTADALSRLRGVMSTHAVGPSATKTDLGKTIRRLDNRTRHDGFRVLHSWDHKQHEFTDDMVPVLMLDFLDRVRASGDGGVISDTAAADRTTLAILLDYYYLHLLALGAMRVWDTDDPDAALERVTGLVAILQGSQGSGHHFLSDAETLLIYALSQFHPEEQAYDRIIERVVTLGERAQVTFAAVSAAVLSSHLRWGFWLMYGRDAVRMRNDNVGDYPWLLNSVLTLLRAYNALKGSEGGEAERGAVLEALLQALAADPWAFTQSAPAALKPHQEDWDEAHALLRHRGPELLDDFEARRPSKTSYFPLALHFNFPHNALVATVTLALLEGRPQPLPLNALFVPELDDCPEGETQEGLARALMAFSRGSPDRLGYQGAMLVAYDPLSGLRSFAIATDALRKMLE